MANLDLHAAKANKKDEFYTQISDIEKEMKHYRSHFKGKTVYCNCDDPRHSNFFKFFLINFEFLGLERLITTGYNENGHGISVVYDKETIMDGTLNAYEMEGNGDFRSEECVEILKEADIVVTNPPFSLFREYVAQLMEYGKKFIIMGNMNAVTCKEIFPLFKDNKMWYGPSISSGDRAFYVPDDYELNAATCGVDGSTGRKFIRVKGIRWFTNLEHDKRHQPLELYKNFNESEFPKYDNYNAVEVSKTCDIPMDYDDVMGVPISFLDKYCPDQFEIVGWSRHNDLDMDGGCWCGGSNDATINGKLVYRRILIRHKNKINS